MRRTARRAPLGECPRKKVTAMSRASGGWASSIRPARQCPPARCTRAIVGWNLYRPRGEQLPGGVVSAHRNGRAVHTRGHECAQVCLGLRGRREPVGVTR
jgi:hypothetical protein